MVAARANDQGVFFNQIRLALIRSASSRSRFTQVKSNHRGNVFAPVSQRHSFYRQYSESAVEIFSEFTRLNHACEIPRGCRDDLHITEYVPIGSEAFDLLFFDRS
jgi:hypothetical protein